jgi:hypothetical protein
MRPSQQRASIGLALGVLFAVAASAADKDLPAMSHDGLELRKGRAAVVYVRPGVDFSQYKRLAILECPVAFGKSWERDRRSSAQRLKSDDLEKIKKNLSEEFRKIFVDELQNKGGYAIVEEGAEDVLVLRPAIIDLYVTAPDTMTPGRNYTLSDSAGAMTLYLEIFDSVTGQILARAIDRKSGRDFGRIQWQNSVTNKAEADGILRRWASGLRAALDEVHGKVAK